MVGEELKRDGPTILCSYHIRVTQSVSKLLIERIGTSVRSGEWNGTLFANRS